MDSSSPNLEHKNEEAAARLAELGASRALVSLTHERREAAASVLFLRDQG